MIHSSVLIAALHVDRIPVPRSYTNKHNKHDTTNKHRDPRTPRQPATPTVPLDQPATTTKATLSLPHTGTGYLAVRRCA